MVHHPFHVTVKLIKISGNLKYPMFKDDSSVSQAKATILLVLITLVLAALLWASISLPDLNCVFVEDVPGMIEIIGVYHDDEITHAPSLDSMVVLRHSGSDAIENDDIYARVYRDYTPVSCNIETFNGYIFVGTNHYGVQWMGGSGCSSEYWYPAEKIAIDFSDGTFHPGNLVRIDIISKETGKVISSDSYYA